MSVGNPAAVFLLLCPPITGFQQEPSRTSPLSSLVTWVWGPPRILHLPSLVKSGAGAGLDPSKSPLAP